MPGKRRSARLKDYDYSQGGMYYVTLCINDKRCVFGDAKDGEMILHDEGKMIADNWKSIPERFANVEIDEYIVMPNHLHGIINVADTMDNNGAPIKGAPTLGNIVGAFKSLTTNEYIHGVKSKKLPPFEKRIWQRN